MVTLVALALTATAAAAPPLVHRAQLTDFAGAGVQTELDITARFYDGDTVVFAQTFSDLVVQDGQIELQFSDEATAALSAYGAPLDLGLQLGDAPELSPRQRLGSSARAAHAFGFTLPSDAACVAGALRLSDGQPELCTGTDWLPLQTGADGSQSAPAASCDDLHTRLPGLPTGTYWLRAGNEVFPAYCDMDYLGGGWTRVVVADATVSLCSLADPLGSAEDVASGSGTAWLNPQTVDALAWSGEVLVRASSSYTRFRSSDPLWSWSNIADATLHSNNVGEHNIEAWSDGRSGFTALANGTGCQPSGGQDRSCLLGGHEAGAWTTVLGVGSYNTRRFEQDAECQSLGGSHRGIYPGDSGSTGSWNTAGTAWIR